MGSALARDVPGTVTALDLGETYEEALVAVGGGDGEADRVDTRGGERDVAASGKLKVKGEDPAYGAGDGGAEGALAVDGDEGAAAFRYGTIAPEWSRGSLVFALKLVPSKGFRFCTDPVLGAALARAPSGRPSGVVTGAVALGPVSATVARS